MRMGLVRLGTVAFDATRVKSANSRFNTLTAATIEKRLAELDLQIEATMNDVAAAETAAGDSGGTTLPESLATSKQRRDKLSEALEAVRAKDEARKKDGVNPDSDRTLRVETVRLFKLRSCQIVLLRGSNCRV